MLPPPEDLEAYEKVQPGFAERLMRIAEKNSDFHIEEGRGVLELAGLRERGTQRYTTWGQVIGTFIYAGGIAFATYCCVYAGAHVVAGLALTGAVSPMVIAAISREVRKSKTQDQKPSKDDGEEKP